MSLLLWALFGVVNGMILNILDRNPQKEKPTGAMLLGMFGALSGGAVAFLLFGGLEEGFNLTLLLIISFEALLVYMLTTTKSQIKYHR